MVIKGHKVVSFDVDDTLVLWDKSDYPEEAYIDVEFSGYTTALVPHEKNINLLKKFAKLGYTVIVWTQSGYDWGEAIVEALDLWEYVDLVMTKPSFYVDDMPAQHWIGPRIWREPSTGEETTYGQRIQSGE